MSTDLTKNAVAAGRLLTALFLGGRQSRSGAAAAARLSRSAAWKAAEDLGSLGLIETFSPEYNGSVGRPSGDLDLNGTSAAVVAGALTREGLSLSIFDLSRSNLGQIAQVFDCTAESPSHILNRVSEAVRELLSASPIPVVGVGLSVPGLFNQATGVAQTLLPLGWRNIPMVPLLRTGLPKGLPIVIAHDATLGALAEYRRGGGRGAQRMLYLTAQRVGVGGALVGESATDAQFEHPLQAGHLIVDPSGPICACGAQGCLELFTDGRAIARALGLADSVSYSQLLEALQRGSVPSEDLDPLVAKLAIGLISLVNTLSPDRVVLSGLLAPIAHGYRDRLEQILELSVVSQISRAELAAAELPSADVLGAAEVAFGPFLRDPAGLLTSLSSGRNP